MRVRIISKITAFLIGILFLVACKSAGYKNIQDLDREPSINPDYSGVTIPCNIAPMNFKVNEIGQSYHLTLISSSGRKLVLKSKDGIIRFPEKFWKKVLQESKGGEIQIEVSVGDTENNGIRFKPIHIFVANEETDPYICYRLLYPGYESWSDMKIVQRCIENFQESPLVENQSIKNNCVNCHSFNQNNPEKFLLHIRGSMGGTYFVDGKNITKTDLKTKDMSSGAVYPTWHPGGKYVVFSSNNVTQTFHAINEKNIEVLDLGSSLYLYDINKNTMLPISDGDTSKFMDTFPEWAPDGKSLYFCRAEQYVKGSDFKTIRYNLVKKSFNIESGSFGKTEIVYDANAVDKSVSFPRISPDGKFLVFTLHNYGTFSIWHKEADLYLMELETGNISKMSLNSNESESWHCWSLNSKWLVFSSKRADGLAARPYFAYIDSKGQCGKPFVLPQKDPELYSRMLRTFNRPEFISGKVSQGPRDFERAARKVPIKAIGVGK